MSSLWLKQYQLIVLDGHGGRPALNFRVTLLSLVVLLLLLLLAFFALGACYVPAQDLAPENLMLKRQHKEVMQKLSDIKAVRDLQHEQVDGLQAELAAQERKLLVLGKALHHFQTILDERKGKGLQMLSSKARWLADSVIAWQALFVKGGNYPRFLVGSYRLLAMDHDGHSLDLTGQEMKYRFESHTLLKKELLWEKSWQPTHLELTMYNSRRKELLKQMITIKGR